MISKAIIYSICIPVCVLMLPFALVACVVIKACNWYYRNFDPQ